MEVTASSDGKLSFLVDFPSFGFYRTTLQVFFFLLSPRFLLLFD